MHHFCKEETPSFETHPSSPDICTVFWNASFLCHLCGTEWTISDVHQGFRMNVRNQMWIILGGIQQKLKAAKCFFPTFCGVLCITPPSETDDFFWIQGSTLIGVLKPVTWNLEVRLRGCFFLTHAFYFLFLQTYFSKDPLYRMCMTCDTEKTCVGYTLVWSKEVISYTLPGTNSSHLKMDALGILL